MTAIEPASAAAGKTCQKGARHRARMSSRNPNEAKETKAARARRRNARGGSMEKYSRLSGRALETRATSGRDRFQSVTGRGSAAESQHGTEGGGGDQDEARVDAGQHVVGHDPEPSRQPLQLVGAKRLPHVE